MGESEIDCLAQEMRGIWDMMASGWIWSRNVSVHEGTCRDTNTGNGVMGGYPPMIS